LFEMHSVNTNPSALREIADQYNATVSEDKEIFVPWADDAYKIEDILLGKEGAQAAAKMNELVTKYVVAHPDVIAVHLKTAGLAPSKIGPKVKAMCNHLRFANAKNLTALGIHLMMNGDMDKVVGSKEEYVAALHETYASYAEAQNNRIKRSFSDRTLPRVSPPKSFEQVFPGVPAPQA
jgi:hypothetical protein